MTRIEGRKQRVSASVGGIRTFQADTSFWHHDAASELVRTAASQAYDHHARASTLGSAFDVFENHKLGWIIER